MCGRDYLQQTSADRPTHDDALEMMREVSLRLDPNFSEWDNPKLLSMSLQQLLENAKSPADKIVTNNEVYVSEDKPGIDVCSTQASSRRDSLRTSVSSSDSSRFQSSQRPDLTSLSVAEQYIYTCLHVDNGGSQSVIYEKCVELLQLSSKPTSLEVKLSNFLLNENG